MTLADITKFVNSRSMVAVAGILMLVAARIAFQNDEVTYFSFDRGILFESANLWIGDHWLTMVINTALILVAALSWMLVIQFFNPFRALTTLPASFFLVMMLSVPDLTDQLCTGSLLAAILPGCVALLWSAFGNARQMKHIYLLFAILSAFSMTQYCFAVYIPVFIIGCIQMKIFSLRTVLACIFGLLTPWWIVLGLGLIDSSEIHAPDVTGFFSAFDTEGIVNIILVSAVTGALCIGSWFGNLMNVITLNANLRAFNGSISLIAVFTIVAMCADFPNAAAYLPTLMLVTSYQLSYMLGRSNDSSRFIPIVSIMLIYLSFYVLRIFL